MKKRFLQIAIVVAIFTGGMIAGSIATHATSVPGLVYWIEDAFFFLSLAIVAVLTFRVWWPLIWQVEWDY